MMLELEIDTFAAPISEEAPCGIDLRENQSHDAPYYELKDLRNAARRQEREQQMGRDAEDPAPLWDKTCQLACSLLATQTKDLEVAVWLCEALVRKQGLNGLSLGFEIISHLCCHFWEGLYPLPDEDDFDMRLAPLAGLSGQGSEGSLIAPLRALDITGGDEAYSFKLWQYHRLLEIENIQDPQTKAEQLSKLSFTPEDLKNAIASTPKAFYQSFLENLKEARRAFDALTAEIDQCCPENPPSFVQIKKILEFIEENFRYLCQELPYDLEQGEALPQALEDQVASEPLTAVPQSDHITSREAAFQQLKKIALFFKEHEPHSPIAYSIERLIRWGGLSLPELMQELIADESARNNFNLLTGLNSASPK